MSCTIEFSAWLVTLTRAAFLHSLWQTGQTYVDICVEFSQIPWKLNLIAHQGYAHSKMVPFWHFLYLFLRILEVCISTFIYNRPRVPKLIPYISDTNFEETLKLFLECYHLPTNSFLNLSSIFGIPENGFTYLSN